MDDWKIITPMNSADGINKIVSMKSNSDMDDIL